MKAARDGARWYAPAPARSMMVLSLLVDLAGMLSREVDLDTLLRTACDRLATALRADRATIWLVDAERGDLVTRVAMLPEVDQLRLPLGTGIAGWVAEHGQTVRVDDAGLDPRFDRSADQETGYTTRSMLAVPIREQEHGAVRGVVQVLNREDGVFDLGDQQHLTALAMQLGSALALTTLRADDAESAGFVLRGPINHIVGRSAAMDAVYERVGLAAESDASVLLRGETGTGKTLFARAIHANSARQSGPFVTVDCTTLPAQLVESELFGHERGAFTGADRRVKGRVEVAQGGTLFLDEIGDLPLEMQGKLLRLLQDRAYERVGGRVTMDADVRVVCATHRDLEKEVRAGHFREDLYYRVRVVEIRVPTLAERGPDEIMTLARHFADLYARKYDRPQSRFSEQTRQMLERHAWPGNVRELEHWVESAVVLSRDGNLSSDHLAQPSPRSTPQGGAGDGEVGALDLPLGLTLEEVTRRYIAATVDACDGNRTEAAKRLEIGRNTITRKLDD